MAALRNWKMDNFLNFVYDDWDEVNDVPLPNRLKSYVHPDDNEQTWILSTKPMHVYTRTQIKNWKLSDISNHPDKMFYYHIWNRHSWDHRFFTNGLLPIDSEVIRMLKTNNNLHLIMMNECEFEKKQALERLDKILKKYKINPKKVWFIHNGEKLSEHKKELNTEINVHTSRSMSTSVQKTFPPVRHKIMKTPGQFFLCHNRSPRIHRYAILCLLKRYGIIQDTNWSLINGWGFNKDSKIQFIDVFRKEDILDLIDEIHYFTNIETKKSNYEVAYTELDDREVQRLPNERSTYENSYVNITTETNFIGEDIHITEKSFKPFFYYQFPMILASHHHLKYLREAYPELDFFDDVINHSYDDIKNDRDRLYAFINEIKRIYDNKEFFIEFYKNNKERFERNHNILANWQNDYDYEFFKKLSEVKPNKDIDIHLVYDNWNEELQEPYHMNCKHVYEGEFMQCLDSVVISFNFPEEHIKRFPLRDVEKNPNINFYYIVTLIPDSFALKIKNGLLPIPIEVINCLKNNKNLYVLFASEQEYESFDSFKILDYWLIVNKINPNQFYLINNNVNLHNYKLRLDSKINVHTSQKLATGVYGDMMICMPNLHFKEYKEDNKLFLLLNRRFRVHRYALLIMLKKEKLLNDIDWSLVNGWTANGIQDFNFYNIIFDENDMISLRNDMIYFHSIEQKKSKYEIEHTYLDNRDSDNVEWSRAHNTEMYENSFFNIATETEYFTETLHISEKSFKAFIAYQYPLILASPMHIQNMKKIYGFDFFDDIIDHSYDFEFDNKKRLKKFVSEIKRIQENKEFFVEFYKNNKKRFIANHQLAAKISKSTRDIDFFKKLCGLYEYEFETGKRKKEDIDDIINIDNINKKVDKLIRKLI